VPYVQCERGVLYYAAPEVLVVGVTSELRERELVPGLGLLGCVSLGSCVGFVWRILRLSLK